MYTFVADYFWAWASVIISVQKRYPREAQRIAYIDLFAGPGRYENGAASTPLLIIERAVADAEIRDCLVTMFNDNNVNNTASLDREINAIPNTELLKHKAQIETGEVGENIVKEFQNARLVPTFLFVRERRCKSGGCLKVIALARDSCLKTTARYSAAWRGRAKSRWSHLARRGGKARWVKK